MSVGGVAGAVLPPHAATSTGTTATHANVVLRERRDTAAPRRVAAGARQSPHPFHSLSLLVLTPLIPSPFGRGETRARPSFPLSALRRGGQGVRTTREGQG